MKPPIPTEAPLAILVPSIPVSVKALRCASTAEVALCGPDQHLRSGCWLDMRSVRFCISHGIDRQERFFQQRGTVKQPQKGRQDSVLIAQVRERNCVSLP
jgi:hypothetical protein